MHLIRSPAARMALHDIASTRALERSALAQLPAHTLMRRAGEAVARLALAVVPHARRIWIAAGPGNNGGDGLEAALHLHRLGREVRVTLHAATPAQGDDARAALERARAAGVPIGDSVDPQWVPELIVDALLGIGANRAPDGDLRATIERINATRAPCLAVDLPSGLDVEHGQALGSACVVATHTLTFITLKPGLFTGAGRDYAGTVWLDALDVDASTAPACAWLAGTSDAAPAARRHASHKGSFGDLVVVGGAPGMGGALLLAARAALAAGAGRVFACPLDDAAALLDPLRPELMLRRVSWALEPAVLAMSTVVCGCGGGSVVAAVLDAVLSRARDLVLDADALNAVASSADLMRRLRSRAAHGLTTVLTPHPLEAARLLACDAAAVQADRLGAAQRLADATASVIVLKGSGSVVAAPGRTPHINPTGNAALATAGTGDVLAGWVGGLWAAAHADDGTTPGDPSDRGFRSAVAAVWQHGAAADRATASPLCASDLIDALMRG